MEADSQHLVAEEEVGPSPRTDARKLWILLGVVAAALAVGIGADILLGRQGGAIELLVLRMGDHDRQAKLVTSAEGRQSEALVAEVGACTAGPTRVVPDTPRHRFAYCTDSNVVIGKVDDGSLETVRGKGAFPLSWRPNGGLVGLVENRAVVELEGTRWVPIVEAGEFYPPLVWLGRDRFSLLSCGPQSDDGCEREMVVFDLTGTDGNAPRIVYRERGARPLASLPGERLLYAGRAEAAGEAAEFELRTQSAGRSASLGITGVFGQADRGPDGLVALVGNRDVGQPSNLYIWKRGNRDLTRLAEADPSIAWIPGERKIAYQQGSRVFLADIGGTSSVVADFGGEPISLVSVRRS